MREQLLHTQRGDHLPILADEVARLGLAVGARLLVHGHASLELGTRPIVHSQLEQPRLHAPTRAAAHAELLLLLAHAGRRLALRRLRRLGTARRRRRRALRRVTADRRRRRARREHRGALVAQPSDHLDVALVRGGARLALALELEGAVAGRARTLSRVFVRRALRRLLHEVEEVKALGAKVVVRSDHARERARGLRLWQLEVKARRERAFRRRQERQPRPVGRRRSLQLLHLERRHIRRRVQRGSGALRVAQRRQLTTGRHRCGCRGAAAASQRLTQHVALLTPAVRRASNSLWAVAVRRLRRVPLHLSRTDVIAQRLREVDHGLASLAHARHALDRRLQKAGSSRRVDGRVGATMGFLETQDLHLLDLPRTTSPEFSCQLYLSTLPANEFSRIAPHLTHIPIRTLDQTQEMAGISFSRPLSTSAVSR